MKRNFKCEREVSVKRTKIKFTTNVATISCFETQKYSFFKNNTMSEATSLDQKSKIVIFI